MWSYRMGKCLCGKRWLFLIPKAPLEARGAVTLGVTEGIEVSFS
jgi:hypothetical protein